MELREVDKVLIENELYKQVMLIIENQYNLEGIINEYKKKSTKIIFKDRKQAIKEVAKILKRFSQEKNIDIALVKKYLITLIEEKINNKNIFEEEFKEARDIVSIEER